jgi:hypothetical protein
VPVDLRRVNTEAAEVANERLECRDVFVTTRLAKLKRDLPVGVGKSAMDLDAVLVEPLLRAFDDFIREVVAEVGMNPAQADLLQEQQEIICRGTDSHHGRDFEVVRVGRVRSWQPGRQALQHRRGAGV